MVPGGKDSRVLSFGSGSGEGGQVACRHGATRERGEYTYLTDVSHGYSTARRSVHPHRFTYQPTYLPTYQPTHQPTGSVSSPPIGGPKWLLTHSYLLILTPPTARHAYSPPRGDSTSTPLEILTPGLYTLMRATDNRTDITRRRTIPPCKSGPARQSGPDCPLEDTFTRLPKVHSVQLTPLYTTVQDPSAQIPRLRILMFGKN